MSIIFEPSAFESNNVFFLEHVKNNVKNDSFFSRIIYSTDYYSLRNLLFSFKINNVLYKEQFLKTTILFKSTDNYFPEIFLIEKQILELFVKYNKTQMNAYLIPIYSIRNQLENNFIKIFAKDIYKTTDISILLKISGIWQTHTNIGLTFKFV